jgi:hypothetical protein
VEPVPVRLCERKSSNRKSLTTEIAEATERRPRRGETEKKEQSIGDEGKG